MELTGFIGCHKPQLNLDSRVNEKMGKPFLSLHNGLDLNTSFTNPKNPKYKRQSKKIQGHNYIMIYEFLIMFPENDPKPSVLRTFDAN